MNSEKNTRISIRQGNIHIEIEGEQDFVKESIFELLNYLATDINAQSEPPVEQQSSQVHQDTEEENKTPLGRLAETTGLTVEQIGSVFDYHDGEIIIHVDPIGKDSAEKQRSIGKLALFAEEIINNNQVLTGQAIGKYLQQTGVDTHHLSRHLNKDDDIIYAKQRYKLTRPGMKNVKQEILKYTHE